ncbi:class I SAM-dependent methyltransferase [Actinomadura vinacea]|uniref:Class I SAM-dependent methyltransferase n=1 Tax=Actinomadura vinacea TaxID=115336 RepID=A0ABN3KHW8_9ACTN
MPEAPHLQTTRTFYDTIAEDYHDRAKTELDARPLDRAMLAAFAELAASAPGPIAELGCGPGRITAHLHSLGLDDIFGIDLSPVMVAVARRSFPGLRFDEGSMTALDLKDGALGGIVAWYSLIHTPPEELPAVLAEFDRVLAPGAHLLVAFQVGDGPLHVEDAWGHPVSLDFNRLSPDHITGLLAQAGLTVDARLQREPTEKESAPQAFLLAHKPRAS